MYVTLSILFYLCVNFIEFFNVFLKILRFDCATTCEITLTKILKCILYYIILYYIIISYYIKLYYIISYYIILYYITSYYIILYHIISYYIILYYIKSYYIILYHVTSDPAHCVARKELSSPSPSPSSQPSATVRVPLTCSIRVVM